MPGSKPSSAVTRSRAPPFAMEPSTRLRVNQWTGEYVDSFLSGGNPIQAPECVRILADRQNQRVANYLLLLSHGAEIWLMTLYDKDEAADLTPKELRHNLMGSVEWHDGTLKLWTEIFEATR